MPRRYLVHLELSGPARQALNSLSEKYDMTQVAMMSNLFEWYAKQPNYIQSAVVAALPTESAREVVRMILQQMAKG